ncbi:MAG: zinc-ribbon domain-containing protein, partial [Desulfobacterales bacterium]|nr:zinc-ribbon domain-containing protein [Desulfobacterales bacterium]
MMPAMLSQYFAGGSPQTGPAQLKDGIMCHECGSRIPANSKFCPLCGHQHLVFMRCENCGKNLAPNAKFCSRCGNPVSEKKVKKALCPKCGMDNVSESQFCMQCGEKI